MSSNEDEVRQFTVGRDDDGVRLDRWFRRHLPQIGFATISRWARTGQVRVDGKRAKPEDRLTPGQQIRVPPGGAAPHKTERQRVQLTETELEEADAMVLHRDRAAIVLNKPPGLATQGGTGTTRHVDRLLEAFADDGPKPRLVHRLDKDTSGVLLTAATPGSAAFFSKRFSGRSAKKVYWALVVGVPEISAGTIELALAKQPGSGGEKMMPDENGQPAKTRYRVVDRAGNRAAWVELEPLTGRTHQLRVHMEAIGHPIVGDGKYGGQAAFLTGSISRKMHLHARRLIIDHPDGTPLDVTAPLPDHFAASMEQLGFDEAMSDALPETGPPPPTREEKKQAARRHAKGIRKERRGERRTRTTGASPKAKKPGKAPSRGPKKGKGSPKPKGQR
ncbi:RluA family pseudouridine synthase [Croceicoccus naphthovorans]|uniref:Pseudouridine synthase n=1 Tax=Croceicoccus naphthovorans TaxID=1348774 RepID=A0A0G3XGZ9_9SPHN|nr:RluA family pseudouridine synthase [Croceicoccus naphthovorans]AKM10810.1 pseudouridine synthase [Croceicoccus naphthovorans]MBB3989018.1 23S rRNA pseudouridine955/2504/2580 synthase [Croceicoccus naphthovorans]